MGRKRWKPQRQVSQEYSPEEFGPAVVAEVESLFKRQFEYSQPDEGEWRLPSIQSWLPRCNFTDEQLDACKTELNEVKASLSDYDINKWQEHTNATNRAGLVMANLRRHRKPELCTQAWCKFYEILHSFPVLPYPKDAAYINTVHLCEAPGAFVSSLNHYITTKGYMCAWQWLASTLNPYYEGNSQSSMIAEDSFIRETLDHWVFGADDTGDIMNEENILSLTDAAKEIAPITLVTADGSVDCQNNPGEQEGSTAPLHLAEVIAAFHILSLGGSLVLKMFTLFESSSICLLYLLNCTFNKVCVSKPATSKSGNSEVYVVCLGYKGMNDDQLVILRSAVGVDEVTLFRKEDLPEEFVSQHRRCVQLFVKLQLQTIEENKQLHQNMSPEVQQRIEQTRRCCALSYISRFNVKTIPHWQYIVDSGKEKFHKSWQSKKTRVLRHVGSYNDRQKALSLTWKEQLHKMEPFQVDEHFACSYEGACTLTSEILSQWTIVTGKPFNSIKSSKFCEASVLQRYTLLLHHKEYFPNDLQPTADLKALVEGMVFNQDTSFMSCDEEQEWDAIPVMDESGENNPLMLQLKDLFGDKVAMVTSNNRENFDRVLIVAEMYRESHPLTAQSHMLTQLRRVLQNMEEGDNCIFPVYESVTRFSAAIVFILQGLFTKLVVLPSSSGHLPYFVVCFSLRGPVTDLVTYLSQVEERATRENVLQFVPIHFLCEMKFYQFICHVNNEILKRTANWQLRAQKEKLERDAHSSPHSSPGVVAEMTSLHD